MWWEQQNQQGGRTIHNIEQEGNLHVIEPGEQDKSFDVVRVKYINLDCIKSIIFTQEESGTGQRQTHIVCKVDIEDEGNLMPLRIFQTLPIWQWRGAAQK